MSALDIFLKLEGIEGESTDAKHKGEIVVLSYEQSVAQPPAGPSGSGGAAIGRARFSGVRFRKPVDKSSVPMLLACSSGRHIPRGVFTFRRGGATTVEFYTVRLTDVLVTEVVQVAGAGQQYPLSFDALNAGSDSSGFLDEVTLAYGKIEWTYQEVLPDGTAGGSITGGWDLTANREV